MRRLLALLVLAALPATAAAGAVPMTAGVANAPPRFTVEGPCEAGHCFEVEDANGHRDVCPEAGHVAGALVSRDGAVLAPLVCVGGSGIHALVAGALAAGTEARAVVRDTHGAAAEVGVHESDPPPEPPTQPEPGLLARVAAWFAALLALD